jgi:hypothetical protein
MGDWDHLHDMHNEGYSTEQISDAAACGYNPYDISLDLYALGLSPKEWEAVDSKFNSDLSEVNSELKAIFDGLVDNAESFYKLTNRYLQIWGELGELYAEIKYGITRHKPHTKGSDGKLGNDFIEIKTISPEKSKEEVRVKRAGNFNKLLLVKIASDFSFEGQLIARKDLPKGEGKYARASWARKKTKPQTVITKSMTSSPEAKIYTALKSPTSLDPELQNKLGLSESDFTKAVSELCQSQKIKRSLEDSKKWIRNTK